MSPLAMGLGAGFGDDVTLNGADAASLPGLVGWGEGDDLGADTSAIASWVNRTGSGLDPAQATGANRPTVKVNAINGRKAALFTAASTQYLQFSGAALSWFKAVAGMTIAVVCQPTSVSLNTGVLHVSQGTVAGNGRISLQGRATPNWRGVARVTDAESGVALNPVAPVPAIGVPTILVMTVDCVAPLGSLFINGALVSTGNTLATPATSNTDSLAITLGCVAPGASPFDGYIGAYAMWNRLYSRAQLAPVLQRWARYFAVPLTAA